MKCKFILLISFFSNMSFGETIADPVFASNLNKLQTELSKVTNKLPTHYRAYLDFFTQDNHSNFFAIRDAWLNFARNLPPTLTKNEEDKLKELAENKLLQQMSLDEVTYYAYVYESWGANECVTRVAPTLNAFNKIYGRRNVPFALSQHNSVLTALYLNFPPPTSFLAKSIHQCLAQQKISEISFLTFESKIYKIDGSTLTETGKEDLQSGHYKSNVDPSASPNFEFEVLSNSMGRGLYVFNFCYPAAALPEDRCFNGFGKATSSRRN